MKKKRKPKQRTAAPRRRAASASATARAADTIDSFELYGHSIDGIAHLLRRLADRLSVGYLAKTPEALAAARVLSATQRAMLTGNAKDMNSAAARLNKALSASTNYPNGDQPAARSLQERVKGVLAEKHDFETAAGREAAAGAILVSLLFAAHRIGAARLFPGPLPSEPATSKIATLLINIDRSTPEKIVRECVRLAGYEPKAAARLFEE